MQDDEREVTVSRLAQYGKKKMVLQLLFWLILWLQYHQNDESMTFGFACNETACILNTALGHIAISIILWLIVEPIRVV